MVIEAPKNQENLDTYHRAHPFTLPLNGDRIVSPVTGTCYFIGDRFAGGNFGEVFSCADDWEHSLVAKIIKPAGDIVETETRALSEIAAASLVRSQHVVQIHDAFVYRGAFYIISQKCACSLRDMMGNPAHDAKVWFPALAKGVLHALHWVHVQGLVHCDVHPGNIFLQFLPDSIVADQSACFFQLGDFGLTRSVQNMDPGGTFLATLRPPEAMDSDQFGPLDHRSDIYQAGLLFLSFLAGLELIFTETEILAGRPRELAERLPHPAAASIAAMLRRHAHWRPSTAREAWLEIRKVLLAQ